MHTRRCTRRLAARVIPPGEESRAQSKRAASWSTHANALLLRWLHAMATVPSSRDACRDVRQRKKKLPVLLVIKRKTCSPSPLLLIVSLLKKKKLKKSLSIIIILLLPRVSSNFICAYHFRVYVIFFATSREYLGILIDTILVFLLFFLYLKTYMYYKIRGSLRVSTKKKR